MERKDLSGQKNKRVDYKKALEQAAAICSRQEQCTLNIRAKLNDWNIPEAEAEKIIGELKKEKFLDDHRFAVTFVKDKFRLNRWGKIKISHMLRQKGITENEIQAALVQIDDEEYFKTCMDLVLGKSHAMKEKNKWTRKGKLYRFAAGRGFEPDLIHRVLNRIEGD